MRANRVTIDARLASIDALRYTPAGVPAVELQLEHESSQMEGGHERKVACEISAIALGPLATELAPLAIGTTLRCQGFLARKYRSGAGLALHVTGFERT